ncbi:hypothetical protein HDU83_008030 [Entophlyctis luteolus]|nr:hypothetical protein HDU83_008030 [Entophlyctis luteolus]
MSQPFNSSTSSNNGSSVARAKPPSIKSRLRGILVQLKDSSAAAHAILQQQQHRRHNSDDAPRSAISSNYASSSNSTRWNVGKLSVDAQRPASSLALSSRAKSQPIAAHRRAESSTTVEDYDNVREYVLDDENHGEDDDDDDDDVDKDRYENGEGIRSGKPADPPSSSSLRVNLRAIERDLEDIAAAQQLRLATMSLSTSAAASSSALRSAPPLSTNIFEPQQRSEATVFIPPMGARRDTRRSVMSVASDTAAAGSALAAEKPISALQQQPAQTPKSEASRSLRSATLSVRSVSSRAELEYVALMEQQGQNAAPLAAPHSAMPSSSASACATVNPVTMTSISFSRAATTSILEHTMSPTPLLALSRKVVEDAEKSVLAMELGEGYPDTRALMLGDGGRLLLPSEIKKLSQGRN